MYVEALPRVRTDEVQLKVSIVFGIAGLMFTFIIGHVLEQNHIHWVPEAAVGVLAGTICAGVAMVLHDDEVLRHQRFNFEFFMIWLLPPIIFEAGYNMDVISFISNLDVQTLATGRGVGILREYRHRSI